MNQQRHMIDLLLKYLVGKDLLNDFIEKLRKPRDIGFMIGICEGLLAEMPNLDIRFSQLYQATKSVAEALTPKFNKQEKKTSQYILSEKNEKIYQEYLKSAKEKFGFLPDDLPTALRTMFVALEKEGHI